MPKGKTLPNWRNFGRIIVFIDAANLEHAAKDLKIRIRYAKLKKFFTEESSQLVGSRFYSARFGTESHDRFLTFLKKQGFRLITKHVKKIQDDEMGEVRKADVDVEISVDALDQINHYDTMVLFSGDSDFDYLIKYLKRHGKRVVVISTKHHVARELVQRSTKFIDLRHIRKHISVPA